MAFPRLVRPTGQDADALGERSDDELMSLSRVGLRRAFAVLVERHAERVVTACGRFVNDADLGRELAQDTWVLVWQGREKYRPGAGFVPWLVTIARNHCRNALRHRRTARVHEQAPAPQELADAAGQLDGLLIEERRQRVRNALSELPAPLREALLLRYAEDLRYDEMALVAGCGESTLRSRVYHALRGLKQKLEEES